MSTDMTRAATQAATWRAPRARLLVNGTERTETGLEAFTLTRTRYSRADTLEMTLAVDRAQAASGLWFDVPAPAAGSVLPDTDIQLQMRDAARDGSQWTTLFQGIVDHVEWSPAETSVHIQCRDYLARLLDMRVLDGWMNMTGADLARAVITAAGLTPDVTMDTAMVGQFWQVEHKRTAATSHGRFQTAFDLVSALAIQAGCDLYASGTTIICAPPPTAGTANTHVLDYADTGPLSPISMGASGLRLTRDYQIDRGVVVHVMSWDSRQRTKVAYYWSAAGGSATAPATSGGSVHSFSLPGARLDGLEQYARQKYSQIVAHARTITGTMPGCATLAPRQFMQVSGTGTTWDGTLDVDSVTSSFSWQGGFSQQVTLRRRDTSTQEDSNG
ncbi:phage late control D family protein [Komagataeibacter rhaeticus]|uniref:phage late control D family protein n=1 Tax=Komagataeibacter rhaeticus TaxID=215221 RepID=UPI0004D9F8A5|nr:hypothetical protein [Komagataeibacter rhaeticus]KDU95904.1 hypothetical protein GLUCORHAEAF1_05625 [Komagataeibacter rhaeticus AF1]GBQ15384.1 hypothetical protein AA16663_2071 [Komagataeibacter rhaeticus DSM 16663]